MAETLTAQLALELGGFTAGLQAAAQAFRQFTTDLTTQIQQLATAFTPLQKAVEETGRQRTAVAKATAAAVTATERQLQRDLETAQRAQIKLQTDLDLERLKIREQQAKVAGAALVNLQRDNIAILLGIEKEQLEQEKALLNAETAQVRATLAAQAALRKEQIIARQAEQRAQAAVDAAFAQEQLATEKALQAAVVALYKQDTQARQAEQRAQAAVDAAFAQEQKQQAARAATDRAATRKALEESVNYQTRILIAQGAAIEKEAAEVSKRLYKETAAEKNRILKTGTDEEKQILTATEAFRRDLAEKRVAFEKSIEDRLATERRLRNNQLRAELTNVRSGAVTPGPQPGVAPVGNQAPFQLAQIQGYISLLQDAGSEQGRFSQSLFAIAGVFGIVGTAIDVAIRVIHAFLRQLRDVAVESVNVAVKYQTLTATFQGISSSTGAARDTLKFLREEAQRLGVDFLGLTGAFKNLSAAAGAAGFTGDQARTIFVAFSEAARSLGLNSDSLQHILVAVEQIISKGKVSAEELRRQMGNFLPGAFNIAATSIGKTTSELDAMLKTGSLVSKDFIIPFALEVQRTFAKGLPEALRTASASFNRFFNEVKDLANVFGSSVLGYLQPVLDFTTRILENMRKAREEREQLRNEGIKETDLPAASAGEREKELQRLFTLIERAKTSLKELRAPSTFAAIGGTLLPPSDQEIQRLEKYIADLERVYKTLQEQTQATRGGLLDEFEGPSQRGTEIIVPFKREAEQISTIVKKMKEDIDAITVAVTHFGNQTDLERAKKQFQEIERAAQDISEAIAKSPGLRKSLPTDIGKEVEFVRQQVEATKELVKALEQEEETQKRIQNLVKNARPLADIEADIQGVTRAITEAKLPGQIAELQEKLDALESEKLVTLFGFLPDLSKSIGDANVQFGDMGDRLKVVNRELKASDAVAEELNAALQKFLKTSGETELEATLKRIQIEADELVKKFAGNADIIDLIRQRQSRLTEEALEKETRAVERALEKETRAVERALKEQEKPWRELGTRIENILAGTFERILQGTTNILDGIKDAFIKLLARLAAEAAAAQIIIGIKAVVGGSLGAGAASLASTVFGVSGGGVGGTVDTAGIVGSGSGAGGGTLGVAQEALGGLSSAYSIYGGLTGQQSVTGGLLNSLGAGSLLSTPLFGTGVGVATGAGTGSLASLGATAAPTFYGSGAAGIGGIAGGGGASVAGSSSAAISGSTILTGAGAGIAAGLLISQLLEAIGFGGTGNSVLSGAAGGAIAGTIILPGIGTAIGAGIGALGGYIASLVGGGKRRPQIDIQNVEGGPVSFNETLGGLTFDPFRITNAPFRDIGQILPNVGNKSHQTTYSNFIAAIGDAANQYFGGIIEGFRSLQPQVQKALIVPLSDIAEQIRQNLEQTKFSGNDAGQQLQDYFSTTLPEFTQNLLRSLTEALDKIDPYVRAFNETITKGQEILERLTNEQQQIKLQIQQQIHGLEEGLFTPAQLFVRRRNEFTDARKFLETATPQQKLATIPLIQSLANDVFALGRQEDVLGQDAPLVRNLQQDIIAVLRGLQSTTDTVYDEIKGQVQEQISLAEEQVNILIASLGNIGSVDSAIAEANTILEQINAMFSVIDDQDAINNAVQLALLSGQLNTLSSIDSVSKEQLGVLRSLSQNQGISGGGGFGSSDDGGEGDGGFARGTGYIPYNMVAFLHQGEAVIPRHQNGQNTGSPIIINVNGSGDPDRVASQVVAKIERQILLGKTSIMGRKN